MYTLVAYPREKKGKNACRVLRREGFLPAVCYGPNMEPENLKLKMSDFQKLLRIPTIESQMLELTIEDGGKKEKVKKVMIKDYQLDPIKDLPLHADLYEVPMDREIAIWVPIELTGKPKGVERGGILEQQLREVEVLCLPKNMPQQIEVDVSGLDIGDVIHVSDLVLPEGVRVKPGPDLAIATVGGVEAEEEAGAEEAEEVEEITEEKDEEKEVS